VDKGLRIEGSFYIVELCSCHVARNYDNGGSPFRLMLLFKMPNAHMFGFDFQSF